jgi:hypothetical protein
MYKRCTPLICADKFHGRRTASGIFDMHKYTAAHKVSIWN